MPKRLLRSTLIVGTNTTFSRILGFVRDMVLARVFGVTWATDAFFVAFRIPNLARRLFAEDAFSSAFVPVITEAKTHQTGEDVARLVQNTVSIGLAFAPEHGADPEVVIQAADLALYEAKRGGRRPACRLRNHRGRRGRQYRTVVTTILIVEDNPHHLMLAETLLELNGYAVIKAENAEDGVKLARERQPDLVLMDITQPGLDGLTALKQLRADEATRALKVIVFTSFQDKHPKDEILASGADAFVAKPYHHQDFLNTLRAVLQHK